jgi:hypothetical protein
MAVATYIFGEREYVLTGREAKKSRQSGRETSMVEIKPVDITDPDDKSFNKWVKRTDLYHVIVVGED